MTTKQGLFGCRRFSERYDQAQYDQARWFGLARALLSGVVIVWALVANAPEGRVNAEGARRTTTSVTLRLGPDDGEPAGNFARHHTKLNVWTNYHGSGSLTLLFNNVEIESIQVVKSTAVIPTEEGSATDKNAERALQFVVDNQDLERILGTSLSDPDAPPLKFTGLLLGSRASVLAGAVWEGYMDRSWMELRARSSQSEPGGVQALGEVEQHGTGETPLEQGAEDGTVSVRVHFVQSARFYLILAANNREALTIPPDDAEVYKSARVLAGAPLRLGEKLGEAGLDATGGRFTDADLLVQLPERRRGDDYMVLWTLEPGDGWRRSPVYLQPTSASKQLTQVQAAKK